MPLLSFQCSLKCIFVCVSSLMKRCALTVSLFEIVSVYVWASWSVSWSQQHRSQSCIRPPGEHLPPTPPTLSCSKQPHITSGLCCFPLLLLSAHKLVTKAENTEMAGRQHKFQKNTLMKGISAAFWSLLDICFLEPPRSCWRQCSLRFLLLFVCWKHSAKANDVWPKPRMRNLKVLCCFILYCETMSNGACHTLLCQWKCNERWDVSRTQNRCQCLHRDTTGLTSKVKLRDVSQ